MSQARKFNRKHTPPTKPTSPTSPVESKPKADIPSTMRRMVAAAEGKPVAARPGLLTRTAYMVKALAYVALAAYVFLVRSQPREALGWFAAAIAYAAMAKDKGVS